jgi:hypothetical protein
MATADDPATDRDRDPGADAAADAAAAASAGTAPDPLDAAREYLLAVRREAPTDDRVRRLAGLDPDALRGLDDDARTAFWVNVYNAATQDLLREDPDRLDSRWRFFAADHLTVAGHELSLNDVEHGLLRGSRLSWGLGYLPRLRPDAFERTHRVAELDPRIHFALNCGAASCPPIAAYEADRIDDQLRLATESYLETDVDYDPDAGVVRASRLFFWYLGDFGGRSGTRAFLREHGALPAGATPRVRYHDYDWSRSLGRFTELDA